MSADLLRRLNAIGAVLAVRMPIVLAATVTLLESMLDAADLEIRTVRAPTAPVTLTAELVLEAARARGVLAFGGGFGDRLILLASLGFDLTDPGIRAALLELYRTGAIQLAPVPMPNVARSDLAHRDERPELLDESAIVDGAATYHALLL